MTCICLDMPTLSTFNGYTFTDDGSWWIYTGPCAAHDDTYTVSPLWHPVYGWLGQSEPAQAVEAVPVLAKAMETV